MFKSPAHLVDREKRRRQALALASVIPDATRCVQCGICAYNCPMGIDVRAYAWNGEPVSDGRCIACGECISRCPRGVLHFGAVRGSS